MWIEDRTGDMGGSNMISINRHYYVGRHKTVEIVMKEIYLTLVSQEIRFLCLTINSLS